MAIDLVIEAGEWQDVTLKPLADRAVQAALIHLGLDPEAWEVTLLACDDARIAELNADFRGKPRPTNVLSWPSAERAPETPGARPAPPKPDMFGDTHLGDIALAHGVCSAEAATGRISLPDHLTHLIVHGLLHLMGYDHETDADAALMEGLETEILGNMGIADPYRDHGTDQARI